MSDDQPACGKDFGQQRLFVFRSAAHAETGGLIASMERVELRLRARFGYALFDGSREFDTAFGGADVVARAALANAEHSARFIADQRGGGGLSAVHAQEKLRHCLAASSGSGGLRRKSLAPLCSPNRAKTHTRDCSLKSFARKSKSYIRMYSTPRARSSWTAAPRSPNCGCASDSSGAS